MSSVSMLKSRITFYNDVYGVKFDSLISRLKTSIDLRNFALNDGANMVNNKCIDNLCVSLMHSNLYKENKGPN